MSGMFDVFKNGYAKMKKTAKKREDGRWELAWEAKNEKILTKSTLIVNEARGYTPEEFRCESKVDGAPGRAADWFLQWENRTRWDQIGGAWVPVHHEHRQVLSPMAQYSETYIYDYHWDSVNQDVDDDVFTYTKLTVPTTVAIEDVSSGETEWIREFPTTEPAPVSFWSTWTGLAVVVVTLILAIAAVGVLLARGRNRRRAV
jgi:hypothetical protein